MKLALVLVGALVAAEGAAAAEPERLSVAARVGGSWANRQGDYSLETDPALHLAASVRAGYRLHRYVAVEAGVGYVMKGYRSKEFVFANPNDPQTELEHYRIGVDLHSVELPLAVRGIVPLGRAIAAYGVVGPSLDLLVDADSDLGAPLQRRDDIAFDRWELNATAGLGIEWVSSRGALGVEALYEHGLTEVDGRVPSPDLPDPIPDDGSDLYVRFKTRTFLVSAILRYF